ncbi:MAG: transposase, partial [Thermodesulfobacteriota bacterium]
GDSFWSDSKFVATTGQVSLDVLKQYVESQGEGIEETEATTESPAL